MTTLVTVVAAVGLMDCKYPALDDGRLEGDAVICKTKFNEMMKYI